MRRMFFCGMCLLSIVAIESLAPAPARGQFAPGFNPPRRAVIDTSQVPKAPAPPADNKPPQVPGDRNDGRDRDRRSGHGHGHGHGHRHHGHHHHHPGRWPWFWLPPVIVSPFPVDYFGYNLPGVYDPTPYVPPQQPAAIAPAPSDPVPQQPFKTTNAEQKARAGRFLQYGDDNFAKQKYLAALGRYKTAISTAPDLADSYLRQGFAYVALGQFENAAKAFRRGLTVQTNWRGSPLKLDALYGPGALVKEKHLESLAKAVEDNPLDSDLLLTLGMELYFDGQPDRAELCFTRAAQLGADAGLLQDFLPRPQPGAAGDPPPRGRIAF